MNVREEIKLHAKDADKPILNWLFGRYHMESQWRMMARCSFQRYGVESYKVHRVWAPTAEGRILHADSERLYELRNSDRSLPEHKARRPYDEYDYPGYVEGDSDYFESNRKLAVALLDAYGEGRVVIRTKVETLENPT